MKGLTTMAMGAGLASILHGLRGLLKRRHDQENHKVINEVDYKTKVEREVSFFKCCENVHDLPQIFHYWSNKYLVPKFQPFGFSNPKEFFCLYMSRACKASQSEDCRFVSIGSGNCDLEIDIVNALLDSGVSNFTLECLDINETMLGRGRALAQEKNVLNHMQFCNADINSWRPRQKYQIVMAIQALHHFVELELLFDKIYKSLHPDGFFVTDDMIGRNGHMRWPEALAIFNELWKELPDQYKYNHLLKRVEIEYENWDCSKEGFEGVRSQDILLLLLKRFHFEFFIAFGNVIDIFVDRCFGHNFDHKNEWDLKFIDRVHEIDESNIEKGIVKPTHMMAAMTKKSIGETKIYKHLSPEFCVRWPDSFQNNI